MDVEINGATLHDDMLALLRHLGLDHVRALGLSGGGITPLYPVSLAFDLHAAIPRSQLWIVPNGGHGPVFGQAAPAFAATALAFLRGRPDGPPTTA